MMRRSATLAFVAAATLAVSTTAQQKPAVTRADYSQWESLSGTPSSGLSPDGRWLAYGINRGDDEDELNFVELATSEVTTIPLGSLPTFTSDSRWAGYTVRKSEDEADELREDGRPVQNALGLLDLASGETTAVEGIQSFLFSSDGKYVAMRRYRAAGGGAGGAGGARGAGGAGRGGGRGGGAAAEGDADPVGITVTVRELATGTETTFGNVAELAWQDGDGAHLLAMAISAADRAGNGVQLFDAATSVLRVLDSRSEVYTGLRWREDSSDLMVMRSHSDDAHDGPTQDLLVWRGLGTGGETRQVFDPTEASAFPSGMRAVTYRTPSWSDDGSQIFFGIAEWPERPQRGGRGGRGAAADESGDESTTPPAEEGQRGRGAGPASAEPDEPADVAVWHWKDTTVMSAQQIREAATRRQNLLSVWHVDDNRVVQLAQSFEETVSPVADRPFAYVEDGLPYAMARSIGRRTADLYLADLSTGERTLLKRNAYDGYAQMSPDGGYLLFVEDGHYWTMSTDTKAVVNITKDVRTSFVDVESDSTGVPRPMFGTAGWTEDDQDVLLYDKHDIWQVKPDGSMATRLTDGSGDDLRHRLVRINPEGPAIAAGQHYVSLFGLTSKQSGYGRFTLGRPGVTRVALRDSYISSLGKADDAEVYGWVEQRHDDSPDIFISRSADLSGATQVTHTNAFQDDYAWSHSEVVSYTSETGTPLQGALYYPAGYEPGRRYPMIVYVYEKLSDSVHRYVVPSETSYYNTSVFTANGYFVLQPDIVFRPKEPGLSVVESVRPAVEHVVELGLADEARVGIIGHSWGGFDTAFLTTHTDTFAAGVAGAAITDLVSNYGNHHWSSGIAETDHIETGQQRMVVPLYEDLDAYIRNSAIYNVQNMTTPLMLMTGDDDGTVFWHQAVSMYNIARRAGKNVVMLVYAGEDHGLRQRKNQIDYQQRILTWFAHYLKGEDAPAWVTDGQTWVERQEEVRGGGGR